MSETKLTLASATPAEKAEWVEKLEEVLGKTYEGQENATEPLGMTKRMSQTLMKEGPGIKRQSIELLAATEAVKAKRASVKS